MARHIIVNLATSADGFIARPDGSVDWLTSRPKPEGFYGMGKFVASVDAKILGRKMYDQSLTMGAKFDGKTKTYVFSKRPPASPQTGVEFISEPVAQFANRVRTAEGKNLWLMGGGGVISSFLDAGAIDQIVLTVMP